jgi:hypothetical protein
MIWMGGNTEEFIAWALRALPALPEDIVWVWALVDDDRDLDNIIEDGILRATAPGVSQYWWLFPRGETVLAGPLYDGVIALDGGGINPINTAILAQKYEEI